jgi:hypothetical protein
MDKGSLSGSIAIFCARSLLKCALFCPTPSAQVKELLAPYGALKSFNLVMDKNTGKSKVRTPLRAANLSQWAPQSD